MKNKNILTTILIIVLFITIVTAIQISTFSNSLTAENLTFTGDENITRNITIFKDANVISAVMNLSGYYLGWNLSTASYDSVSFSLGSEATFPTGIFFKPDGTKMYVADFTSDNIYQYTLSSPWNLSTASYDSVSFGVGSEEVSVRGIFFKPDGTKIYITGTFLDAKISQYTLSSPWNLSTASYDSVQKDVSSEQPRPYSVFFKPDGTKMYVSGHISDNVSQYTLSSPWNLSTASYDSVSFGVDSQPTGLFFGSNGGKMYTLGQVSDRVSQYTLSSPWNLSTASSDSVFYSVGALDSLSSGIFFRGDGVKMYTVGAETTQEVYQHTLALSDTPTDPYLQMNNTQIWNHTGEFNSTFSPNKTDDFASTLNTALNGGLCDCAGCSLSGDNCTIDFIFHSDTAGILEYSNIDINWDESVLPTIDISEPSGSKSSITGIPFSINASDNHQLDFCTYWVTRGASLEISNTTVTCSESITGNLGVSSGDTNYVFHFFINDSSGNSATGSSSFSTSGTSGGGGGGSSGIIIIGGGITGWEMETAPGIGFFEKSMVKGSSLELNILFNNIGGDDRTITLSCEEIDDGDICKYVTFPESPFLLPKIQDIQTLNPFVITLPDDLEGGSFTFNVVGTDDLQQDGRITVFLTVNNNFFTKIVSRTPGGIPYLLIFIIGLVGGLIVFGILFSRLKIKPVALWSIVISLAISIGAVLLF